MTSTANRIGARGYKICRSRSTDEVPWLRPADCVSLGLDGPVALVNGAFDLLHAGHMRLLFAAADRAKSVVVALDSDEKVRSYKGHDPFVPWSLRATTLKYMPISAIVEINNDREFVRLCRLLRPDFRVLSAEYIGHISRVPEIPTIYVPERGWHTSDYVRRLKEVTMGTSPMVPHA